MRVTAIFTWFPFTLVLLGCAGKSQDDAGIGSSSVSSSTSNPSETSAGAGCGDGTPAPGDFCFKHVALPMLTFPLAAVGGHLHGEVQASFVVLMQLTAELIPIEYSDGQLLQGAPIKLIDNPERQLRLANFKHTAFPEIIVTSVLGRSGMLAIEEGVLGPYEEFVLQDSTGMGRLAPIDLDGDGLSEIVKGVNDAARVWINSGGEWVPQKPSFIVEGCKVFWDAAVGDFNNDGLEDIAFIGSPTSWDPGFECDPIPSMRIKVLLATGDADLLKEVANIPTGQKTSQIVTGDFNGDKVLDLAVASGADEGVIALKGVGDGQFEDLLYVVEDGQRVIVGDYDGDGIHELATNRFSPEGFAQVWIIDSVLDGALLNQISDMNAALLASADINGDGVDDLATVSIVAPAPHLAIFVSEL